MNCGKRSRATWTSWTHGRERGGGAAAAVPGVRPPTPAPPPAGTGELSRLGHPSAACTAWQDPDGGNTDACVGIRRAWTNPCWAAGGRRPGPCWSTCGTRGHRAGSAGRASPCPSADLEAPLHRVAPAANPGGKPSARPPGRCCSAHRRRRTPPGPVVVSVAQVTQRRVHRIPQAVRARRAVLAKHLEQSVLGEKPHRPGDAAGCRAWRTASSNAEPACSTVASSR